MANKTPTKTSFSSENQPTERKPRGPSERTKILKAFKDAGKTEDGFYKLLVERAHDKEDNFSFGELLKRISPIPKSTSPMVKFDFPKDAEPHIQANYTLSAVAAGIIPGDIAALFIQSIKAMNDIEEHTSLKERIDNLEKALQGGD
jgi:hypothetical protein